MAAVCRLISGHIQAASRLATGPIHNTIQDLRILKTFLLQFFVLSALSFRVFKQPRLFPGLFLNTCLSQGFSSSSNLVADESTLQSKNEHQTQKPLQQVQYVLNGVTQCILYCKKLLVLHMPCSQTPPLGEVPKIIFKLKMPWSCTSSLGNEDPNKIDLVGKLVRGMRVDDVLSQLKVTDKQAAKTMYQAIHSAQADATYKHGLDPDHLLVAGASIGKGFLGFSKKRLSYHGKGNGIKVRPKYQLTVILREIAPEHEPEIARQRASNFLYLSKRLRLTKEENKQVPLQLIRKHKGKFSNGEPSGMAS